MAGAALFYGMGKRMITSTANQQVKNIIALTKKAKERKKQNLFVVEGTKMVQEAKKEWIYAVYVSETYARNPENEQLILTLKQESEKGVYGFEVFSDSVFKSVSDTQTPQGILALIKMPSYEWDALTKKKPALLLVLDSVQDPGNLGTMIRTGEGAGITGVIMNKTTVDLFNPKTIRSTMGSIYRVPFYIADDLPERLKKLKKEGVLLFAAHLKGEKMYDAFSYTGDCGFLIGNEGNGLSDEIARLADTYIKIPMEGKVESLNAAIAASLLLYEANRQRRVE